MSTDSTELTFVRCPSCRSLVPAVSTRCRMCGAALDPAAKVDEASEVEKRSGRVRQKTMSTAHSELSTTAGQIREEMGPTAEEDPFGLVESDAAEEAGSSNEDPLGDYIQEVEEEPRPVDKPVSTFKPAPAQAKSNGPQAPSSTQEIRPSSNPEPRREQPRQERERPRDSQSQQQGEQRRGAADVSSRPPGARPGGLSFSRAREEQKSGQEESDRPRQAKPQEARPEPRQEAPRNEGPRFTRETREHKRPEGAMAPRGERHTEPREEPRAKGREQQEPQRQAFENPGENAGRLFGWLVSYEQPDGTAIELREGKFFITGSQLKKNDLVISGKNLSTPHVMVSISREQGLRVQDLMSESGTYLRRRSSQTYEREEGVVQLDHGDWVKFGNAEFCVAVIAYGK